VGIDAALAVTGADVSTIEALLDRQLLVRRGDGLGMLETIREYASERLAEDGDADAAHLRHAEFWTTVAEQAERGFEGPDWRAWRHRVLAAVHDFRAALAWSIAHDHTELALRTATALQAFWAFSSQYGEAHRWLTEALTADCGRAPALVRAAALWARSMFPQGSLDQAEQDAHDALTIYVRASDRVGMSLRVAASSDLYAYRGDFATATAIAARAIDLAESAGDDTALAWAYWFGIDAAADFDVAQSHLAGALTLAHRTGAGWRVGRMLQRIAFIATESGRYREAQMLLAEALPQAQLAEDHQIVADIHGNQTIACLHAGDYDGAARAAAEQLILARRERVKWITEGLLIPAALAAERDRADAAAALYGGAEELHNARVRLHSERLQFEQITERHIEKLRARQPLRWTLGVERGRSMTYDELIDLALGACDPAPARSLSPSQTSQPDRDGAS
jgi:tetratricopeptide (TPR) repeat protein